MINKSDLHIGDVVKVYCDEDNVLYDDKLNDKTKNKSKLCTATILAINSKDNSIFDYYDYVVIEANKETDGWEPKEYSEKIWPELKNVKNKKCFAIPFENIIEIVGGINCKTKSTIYGYNCIECNNYNEYAEANWNDKHICFSCKSGSNGWKYK